MLRVRFLREAEAELDEAVEWYSARDDTGELAEDFLDEVMRVKRLVSEHPNAWPELQPGIPAEVRRIVLRRFPYSLIYAATPTEVQVFAVAHHKRAPGYWRGRG